jgi:hypothetical protein
LLVPFLILGLTLGGCSSRQTALPPSTEGTSAPTQDTADGSPSQTEVPRSAIRDSRWRDMKRVTSEGLVQAAKAVGVVALIGGTLFLVAGYAFVRGMK